MTNLPRHRFLSRNGIELEQEGIMPEQPDDPIHYEMKIPPEPKDNKPEKGDDGSEEDGSDKETPGAHKGEQKPGS